MKWVDGTGLSISHVYLPLWWDWVTNILITYLRIFLSWLLMKNFLLLLFVEMKVGFEQMLSLLHYFISNDNLTLIPDCVVCNECVRHNAILVLSQSKQLDSEFRSKIKGLFRFSASLFITTLNEIVWEFLFLFWFILVPFYFPRRMEARTSPQPFILPCMLFGFCFSLCHVIW